MDTNTIAKQADEHSAAGHEAFAAGNLTLANHHWAVSARLCELVLFIGRNPYYDPETRKITV